MTYERKHTTFTFPMEVTLHPTNHDIRYRVGARLRNNWTGGVFPTKMIGNGVFCGMFPSTISSECQYSIFFYDAGRCWRKQKPQGLQLWEIQFWLCCDVDSEIVEFQIPAQVSGHP